RIFTIRDDKGTAHIELGAEFVHGRPQKTREIVNAAGLRLYEVAQSHWQFRDGMIIKSGEFWSELDQIMNGMKDVRERDLSFNEYLDKYCGDQSDEAKSIATMFVQGFHAARADVVSVKSLNQGNDAAD